jgi:hypothetical protein
MSWHYSQALVAACSQAASSDGEQSAPLSMTGTDASPSWPVRMTGALSHSRYGVTFGPSTDSLGADVLTWFLAGFPVRRIPQRLEARTTRTISGRKCGESWQRQLPGTYLPRTSPGEPSTQQPTTSRRWVTRPAALPFPRRTWVQTTHGPDIGLLHTPTATANFAAPSMQKWKCCREFVRVFGKPTPESLEYLMGWPGGWTALAPLAMDKWQSWLQRHGAC